MTSGSDTTDFRSLLADRASIAAEPYTIYFAGGLFNHKELIGNAKLAEYINRVSRGRFVCILPQDLEQAVDRGVANIRNQDLLNVMKHDLAIFNFDGPDLDSGTVVEMVFGKMLDIPAVILRTDFRPAGDGMPDGDPWNLMCSAYPRCKILLLNSMAWYHEARDQGGSIEEIEDLWYTRMAKAVIEQLDAVLLEKGYLTPDISVQEIYKAALRFPGAGLEKTPDSFLRSIIRRKVAKGLLPKESESNHLVPHKAQRLSGFYNEVLRRGREVQMKDPPMPPAEVVLDGKTIARCEELMQGVLDLDQYFGECVGRASELLTNNTEFLAATLTSIAQAVQKRAAELQTGAESAFRESTFKSRTVFHLPHVSIQGAALRSFTEEIKHVAGRIAEEAAARRLSAEESLKGH